MADKKTVPVFDPSGKVRQIPEDQVDAALQSGGKRAVRMSDPQGTARWVRDTDVDAATKAGGKTVEEGLKGTWEKLLGKNPISDTLGNVASHVAGAVTGPVHAAADAPTDYAEAAANIAGPGALAAYRMGVKPTVDAAREAFKQARAGNISPKNDYDAAGNYHPSAVSSAIDAIPVVGPWSRNVENEAHTKGVVPALAGMATDIAAPEVIPKAVTAVPGVVGKTLSKIVAPSSTVDKVIPGDTVTPRQRWQQARQQGVNLDTAQATNARVPGIAKKVSEHSLTGSGKFTDNSAANVAALEDHAKTITDKITPDKLSREDFGSGIQEALRQHQAHLNEQAGGIFDDLDSRVGDVHPDLGVVRDQAQKIVDENKGYYKNHPEFLSGAPGKAWSIVNSLAKDSKTAFDPNRVMRFDEPNASLSADKPHGLYLSQPSEGMQSPHSDVGSNRYEGTATGKNVLNLDNSDKVEHARFGAGNSGHPSAGVSALKKLSSPEEFDQYRTMTKPQLVERLNKDYPGPDYSKYHDSYELLEALGAQKARAAGYDALRQTDSNAAKVQPDMRKHFPSDFSEYVALRPNAVSNLKAVAEDGSVGSPDSWSNLHKLRSDLMNMYRSPDIVGSNAEGWLKQLTGKVDESMTGAASGLSPADEAKFRAANKIYTDMKQTYDNPQHKLFSIIRAPDGLTVANSLADVTPHVSRSIWQAGEDLGMPEIHQQLQRQTMERLLDPAGNGTPDLKNLPQRFSKAQKEKLGGVLTPDQVEDIDQLARTSKVVHADSNPSGTAKTIQPASEAGSMVAGAGSLATGLATGNVPAMVAGAVPFVEAGATRLAASKLTNPEFTEKVMNPPASTAVDVDPKLAAAATAANVTQQPQKDEPTIQDKEVVPADASRGIQPVTLPVTVPPDNLDAAPGPDTHHFSKSAWADKNPTGDPNEAAKLAEQAGYEVQA